MFVCRQICLWDNAFDLTGSHHYAAVVQASAVWDRCTHNYCHVRLSACFGDSGYAFFRPFDKQTLSEQVTACGSCNAKLREYNERCTAFLCLADQVAYFFGVVYCVGNLYCRHGSCRAYESVILHIVNMSLNDKRMTASHPFLISVIH